MELQFASRDISSMRQILHQVISQEETQEIRLSDALPDVGRVVCARGQAIVRTKQWRQDSVSVSGGIMVWVLYAPEDGTREQWVDTWIPFQLKWEIPRSDTDGILHVLCQAVTVDARTVSARKIMVRSVLCALAQAYLPGKDVCYSPGELPEDVCVLKNTYPIRVIREAGEKSFTLEEELTLPQTCQAAYKILCYTADPKITEQYVTGDKVVFRGNTNLHVLYSDEDGAIYAWDFEHPFSQLAQLENVFSPEAQAQVLPELTSLDLALDDEGKFLFKCGMVGQYIVDDTYLMELAEDAYSTTRMLSQSDQSLEIPVILEKRRDAQAFSISSEGKSGRMVDGICMPVQPRTVRSGTGISVELGVQCQMLFYDEGGNLRADQTSWEDTVTVEAEEKCSLYPVVMLSELPSFASDAEKTTVDGYLETEILTCATSGIPMVTALELGEQKVPEADRPSLILRRAGERRLWDIAKHCNTTVDAICSANHLNGQPEPEKMLLIPIG